ncbi:MAG: hypothetical protein RLZZ126_1920 [Pseudomonadota bacterium]
MFQIKPWNDVCWRRAACLWAAVLPLAAAAQPVSDSSVRQIDGSYSLNCSDTSALRLTVRYNRMELSFKGKRVGSTDLFENKQLFGPSPPAGFMTAVIGKIPPASSMRVVFYVSGKTVAAEATTDLRVVQMIDSPPLPAARLPKC